MYRFAKMAVIWITASAMLTGCWDLKNAQDINYFTAIGFDYADDEYVVYVQMLDFTTVAKTEAGASNENPQVWIGIGRGETPSRAVNDLYDTAQLRVFYGHIDSIILSENVIKQGMETVLDALNRYYEMRYTPWLFATDEPIDKLMSVSIFFNMSSIVSLMHQPKESFKQKSKIPPKESHAFIQQFREPGNTAFIPSLGLVAGKWEKNEDRQTMMDIDGIFVFKDKKYKGKLPQSEIKGLRWTREETNRSPVYLHSGGKITVVLSLERPRVKIEPRQEDGKITYHYKVKLGGNVSEIFEPLPEAEMEKLAAQYVREEIRDFYEKGLKIDADVLRLEHALYRQNNALWKKQRDAGQLRLTKESLQIEVDVQLESSGKMKMRQ